MCISIFYAQVLGIWLFIIGLAMIMDSPRFKKAAMEMMNNSAMMTCSGCAALGLGLLLVVSHNIWVGAWPVVVTLIGWIFIFQGIMRLFRPESFAKMMKDMMSGSGYTVMSWVWLLVGLYLIWAGFVS